MLDIRFKEDYKGVQVKNLTATGNYYIKDNTTYLEAVCDKGHVDFYTQSLVHKGVTSCRECRRLQRGSCLFKEEYVGIKSNDLVSTGNYKTTATSFFLEAECGEGHTDFYYAYLVKQGKASCKSCRISNYKDEYAKMTCKNLNATGYFLRDVNNNLYLEATDDEGYTDYYFYGNFIKGLCASRFEQTKARFLKSDKKVSVIKKGTLIMLKDKETSMLSDVYPVRLVAKDGGVYYYGDKKIEVVDEEKYSIVSINSFDTKI